MTDDPSLLVVLPVIDTTTTDICVESILMPDSAAGFGGKDMLLIDNTREGNAAYRYQLRTYRDPDNHNLGVARAWNVGAREVLDRGLDYLVLLSSSMRFGPAMHTKWTWQMKAFWGSPLIECDGHSWHLIAIHREMFEKVGLFDGNFFPGYIEAVDWDRRIRLTSVTDWPRAWVNALSQGTGLALNLVSCPAGPLLDYYKEKWGGEKGAETYSLPFGDKPLDYWEDVPIPVLAERYSLETWW